MPKAKKKIEFDEKNLLVFIAQYDPHSNQVSFSTEEKKETFTGVQLDTAKFNGPNSYLTFTFKSCLTEYNE